MRIQSGFRLARLGAVLVAAGLMSAACQAGNDGSARERRQLLPGGITQTVRAVFDSASAAFVAGDALLARQLFSEVVAQDTSFAAAWVGLSLAERAVDRVWSGDSALDRARDLIDPPRRPRSRGQPNPAT